jgi:ribonuclease P protein component
VSTRRIGIAVLRNQFRRRIREIFRRHQHRLPRGLRLVTIARKTALTTTLAELERDWLRLAERASILAAA